MISAFGIDHGDLIFKSRRKGRAAQAAGAAAAGIGAPVTAANYHWARRSSGWAYEDHHAALREAADFERGKEADVRAHAKKRPHGVTKPSTPESAQHFHMGGPTSGHTHDIFLSNKTEAHRLSAEAKAESAVRNAKTAAKFRSRGNRAALVTAGGLGLMAAGTLRRRKVADT